MNEELEARVQSCLDEGRGLEADPALCRELEAAGERRGEAAALEAIDAALRAMPRPSLEADRAASLLSRLDEALASELEGDPSGAEVGAWDATDAPAFAEPERTALASPSSLVAARPLPADPSPAIEAPVLGTLNSPLPETSVSFLWALPVAAAAVIALGLFVALQLEKVREGELAMASQADADPAALPAASAPLEELGATESPSPRPPPAPGPPAAGPLPPGSPAAAELSPEQATPQAGAEFDPRLEGEASPEPPGAGPYLASEGLGDPSLGSAGGSPRDEPAARRSRRRLPATGAAEMASTKRARAGAGGSMAIGEFSPVEASPSPATTARALRRALESRASRVRACPVDAPRSISVIVSIDATRRSVQDVEIPELASGSELAGCVRAALRGAPLPTTGALPSRLRLSFSVGR